MAIRWKSAEDFEALIRRYAEQAEAAKLLAEADVEAGRFRFLYNEAVHYDFVEGTGEYFRLLKERLGVDGFVRHKIEAPNFDAASVFEAVYNRCMSRAIEARFGTGILDRLREEAVELYRRKWAASR